MADVDPLVHIRNAAFACNDAAKNTLEFLRWLNSNQPSPSNVFALAFPRGQVLHGRPGEPPEEALRRDGPRLWTDALQKAIDGWNAAVYQSKGLEQIMKAAISLHLPPLQIGIDSFVTAHEAARRRASELLYFFQGEVETLSDEISIDHRGRIEQEYQEAVRLQGDAGGKGGGKGTRKPRGPRKANYETVQKEAKIAAEWELARDAKTYKGDFARDKKMTTAELDRLLDRVAKRKKSSE